MNFSLPRALVIGALLTGASALAPQGAAAAVTCDYTAASHELQVWLSAQWDFAMIERNADGTLALNGVHCGTATVHNTDTVYVMDLSGESTHVALEAGHGPFAPGYTDEGLFGSEIEFDVKLGAGNDQLVVDGEETGAAIAAGAQGINLNTAAEPLAGDTDVTISGVESLALSGGGGDDWLSGQGGSGTGSPYTHDLILAGGDGADELHGGENPLAAGFLHGNAGDDQLVAGSQGDRMQGGPGNDTIAGGAGYDGVDYIYASAGVAVDLTLSGPQDTRGAGVDTITGVEWLTGSDHADALKGTPGPDSIYGRKGDDLIDGRGGYNFLHGEEGADTLRNGAGEGKLAGGDGEDTAAYDDAPGPVTVDLSLDGVAQDPTGSGSQTLEGIEDVVGSPFADRLFGSAGANAIDGGAGADAIEGREGSDRLAGGGGLDAVDSRDGSPDFLSCGEGPDSLAVDALDTVAPDCAPPGPGSESSAPGGQPGGAGDSGPVAPALAVRVPRQSLRSVGKRGLRVVLSCSTDCRAGGRLVAARRTARRLGLGKSARSRRVGILAPVDLTGGAARHVRIRLTRKARAALSRARAARLVLRTHAADSAGRTAPPVRTAIELRAR